MTDEDIAKIVRMEYGLELLEFFIDELSTIQGLERVGMFRPTHRFMVNEADKEKAALLTDENDIRTYNELKIQAAALVANGKEQLKEIVNKKTFLHY